MLPVVLFALLTPSAEPRVVGYFCEWSIFDRKYHVDDIPAAKLTHVNYGFVKIVRGEAALVDAYAATDRAYPGDTWDKDALRGNFRRLQLLKKKHPKLAVMLSLGGWTLSGPFSDIAADADARTKLAKSSVALMRKYGFDGLDIDWEYPVSGGDAGTKTRKEDRANYTLLLKAFREHLDAASKLDKRAYSLSIAAPAGPTVLANLEIAAIGKVVDWVNLMSYDFHGAWDNRTGFNAALYPTKGDPAGTSLNVDAAVTAYLKAGMPAEKIVIGLPFYGRGRQGVKDVSNGLYQPAGPGLPKGTWEAGVYDYKDLAKNHLPRMTVHRHKEAGVPWAYDAKTGVFISFDDAESIRAKGAYAKAKGMGGVMIWELSADDPKSTLLNAAREGLGLK